MTRRLVLFFLLLTALPITTASSAFAQLSPLIVSQPPVKSSIAMNLPSPIPNAANPTLPEFSFALFGGRSFEYGDFNGDGLNDILVAPTFQSRFPQLPIEIWINQGNGAFADQTTSVIDGSVPLIGTLNGTYVADFNGDGRADVFLVDQGLEDDDATSPSFQGYKGALNRILLSQPGGRLKETTETSLAAADNLPSFNHVSSFGDVNGDGFLDISITRLGSPTQGGGILFLLNDGKGRFTASTRGLPAEIAYSRTLPPPSQSGSRHNMGSNGVVDLDGDGRTDLVTGTYNHPDGPNPATGTRTLRFYQQLTDGSFSERARLPIPAAITNIGYLTDTVGADGIGLGAAGIQSGDLNGDNRPDVLIYWEGAFSKGYVEILRNDGNFHFTDVTLEWLSGYSTRYLYQNTVKILNGSRLRDFSGDGVPDFIGLYPGDVPLTSLQNGIWQLAAVNDGSGRMQGIPFLTESSDFGRALGCAACGYRIMLFDATGDGRTDIVMIDNFAGRTPGPPYREGTVFVYTFAGQGPSQFDFRAASGISRTSAGTSPTTSVGQVTIQVAPTAAPPSGLAIFGLRQNGVLITEAGVPAVPPVLSGRTFAEVSGTINTGLAIANPNGQDATVSFFFTDANGNNFGDGSVVIPANGQIAKFLDQEPFNSPRPFTGTLSFTANSPVGVLALRGNTNERNEFLITTLPVVNTAAAPASGTQMMPHFADGGGWTTEIVLVNPTDATLAGNVTFTNSVGVAATVTIAGQTASAFAYSLPPRSSRKLVTAGAPATAAGSVRVIPSSDFAPIALVVFSFKSAGVTVTEAGAAASAGTAFRMYVELSDSIQTGLAIANATSSPAIATLSLLKLDGTASGVAPVTVSIPASGHTAKFLTELFPGLTNPFQGLLRITTSSQNIAVISLRARYNERNDLLITTTPPANEAATVAAGTRLVFAHLADGGGYTTQFILFGTTQGSSGGLQFLTQSGRTLNLSLKQ